jgi:hypothetical protein
MDTPHWYTTRTTGTTQKKWGATQPNPKTMTNKKKTHPTSKKTPHA